MQPDDDVWEDIRRAYEHTDQPLPELLAHFSVTHAELTRRRRAGNWTPRSGAVGRKNAAPGQPTNPREKSPQSGCSQRPSYATIDIMPRSTSGRRALVRRLSRAIDARLALLERRMAKELSRVDEEGPPSAADIERDIRAIGTLLKSLEQASDPGADPTIRSSRQRKKAGHGSTEQHGSDTSDRLRRELGERLQRLVEAAAKETDEGS